MNFLKLPNARVPLQCNVDPPLASFDPKSSPEIASKFTSKITLQTHQTHLEQPPNVPKNPCHNPHQKRPQTTKKNQAKSKPHHSTPVFLHPDPP